MPGILAEHGWHLYKVNERGALELTHKARPGKLNKHLGKAVADLTKTLLKAANSEEALAAVWCLDAKP